MINEVLILKGLLVREKPVTALLTLQKNRTCIIARDKEISGKVTPAYNLPAKLI